MVEFELQEWKLAMEAFNKCKWVSYLFKKNLNNLNVRMRMSVPPLYLFFVKVEKCKTLPFLSCLIIRTIYEKLASAFTEEMAVLYRQRVDEISPNLRYCAYNIGECSGIYTNKQRSSVILDSYRHTACTINLLLKWNSLCNCVLLSDRWPECHQWLDADETDWRRWRHDGWETRGEHTRADICFNSGLNILAVPNQFTSLVWKNWSTCAQILRVLCKIEYKLMKD